MVTSRRHPPAFVVASGDRAMRDRSGSFMAVEVEREEKRN